MSGEARQKPPTGVQLFLKMGGWFVLILGAILLLLSVVGQANFMTAERFEREGRMAQAEVVKKYTSEHRDQDGDLEITYRLVVAFITAQEDAVEVDRSVGKALYQRVETGGFVDVLYLESEPQKVELAQGSNREGATFLKRLCLVLGLCWLAGLWVVGGWAVAAARARRYGTGEDALVAEVRESRININNRPRFRLVWVDTQGREGASLLHIWDDLAHFKAGDRVAIYRGVKRSWWVGDIGVRPGNEAGK